ncbi:RNA polymerase sigma factor [Paenibacillus sp. GCM10027626]|uniref:RNA polymerase sigma factor n=1 Tax=Paenibacillus sp. GCM10027626 TaxID=3273411 RepID=UPI00363090E3
MTEQDLLRAIKDGDTECYAEIVRRYQQQLFVYCYHLLVQREEAEDAVQEVLIKAFEKLERYRYEQSFSAWLYKIAYHHCMNVLKKRKRWTLINGLLKFQSESAVEEDGYNKVERDELKRMHDKALQRLTPLERSLIVLRVIEERPYEEISAILNSSCPALRKKVERTKTKLRTIWNELEGQSYERKTSISSTAEYPFIRT